MGIAQTEAWKYRALQAVPDARGGDEARRKLRLERSDVPGHICTKSDVLSLLRNLDLILYAVGASDKFGARHVRGSKIQWLRAGTLEPDRVGSNLASDTHWLGDLGQVTSPPWALVPRL